jgi:hypothetical protein
MKLKVVKPVKEAGPAAPRGRVARPQQRAGRGQDLGDRRLQLLLGVKVNPR